MDEEHAPALSPTLAQCTGDCQRMLSVDSSNFHIDRHLKSGFKSKCKRCMSTMRPRLEPAGSSMEADALVHPDPTDVDGPSIERWCETCTQLFVLDPEVYAADVCQIPAAGLMYPAASQPMSLHFYCPECLDDGHCGEFDSCANTPQDRRERAATDLQIVLLLQSSYSRPDRLYNLRAMPANGACFFHAIAFLPTENLLSFCHEVAKVASSWYDKRWLPEKQDRADFIACWKSGSAAEAPRLSSSP